MQPVALISHRYTTRAAIGGSSRRRTPNRVLPPASQDVNIVLIREAAIRSSRRACSTIYSGRRAKGCGEAHAVGSLELLADYKRLNALLTAGRTGRGRACGRNLVEYQAQVGAVGLWLAAHEAELVARGE